jgi:hypothetical protein
MLQLSENKRRRQAQIAKKLKNAGYASAGFLEDAFLHFSHFFSSSRAVKHHAVLPLKTLPPPRIGIFRPPVLPWTHHHQPAMSAISPQAWGRGE